MLDPVAYFGQWAGHPALTDDMERHASALCYAVNRLLLKAKAEGVTLDINPVTGTLVSGEQYGGWRPPECAVGARNSAHKTGQAVVIYDPDGDLDTWIMNHQYILADNGLYLEHPAATRGWCHLSTRPTRSGNRVFYP